MERGRFRGSCGDDN